MLLDYKERFDSGLSAIIVEIKQLEVDFCKLEFELAISRKVNDKLIQQFILVKKCWANEQYYYRECLEISGIREYTHNDDLENSLLKLFDECGTPVYLENIESCYCVKWKARPKKVIINFCKRKDVRCVQYFTV